MLDTGSGPNLIKEQHINNRNDINHINILKLNGINNYPVFTLGEIILTLFGRPVSFHIVSDDFPIVQSGILGSEFFKQTFAKIDYSQGYLKVAGERIPFHSSQTISEFEAKLPLEGYLEDLIDGDVCCKVYSPDGNILNKEKGNQVPTMETKPTTGHFINNQRGTDKGINLTKRRKGTNDFKVRGSVGFPAT